MTYGALCRGLLSGKVTATRTFERDDLRNKDPKFRPPRRGQYLAAVERLDAFASERFHKGILHLAVRWVLDHGSHIALWGGRHPGLMDPRCPRSWAGTWTRRPWIPSMPSWLKPSRTRWVRSLWPRHHASRIEEDCQRAYRATEKALWMLCPFNL
jgi:hypothetical protein